jgi:hypothetical protein
MGNMIDESLGGGREQMSTSKASILAYEATRLYVKDNYPELEPHFDGIWKLSMSKRDVESRVKKSEQKRGAVSFVVDDSIAQIAQVVIPFFSGVFSSIVADLLLERLALTRSQTTLRLKAECGKVGVAMKLNEQLTLKLLPYAVDVITKESRKKSRKKRRPLKSQPTT